MPTSPTNTSNGGYYDSSAPVSSGSVPLGFTPTTNRLLISCLAVNKDSGSITFPSSTISRINKRGASVSLAVATKLSQGNETNFPWSWGIGSAGYTIFNAQLPEGVGDVPISVVNPTYSDTAVTSITTGAVGPFGQDAVAIAIHAIDTERTITDPGGWDFYGGARSGVPGEPTQRFLTKFLPAGQTVSATWTTDVADQQSVAMLIFPANTIANTEGNTYTMVEDQVMLSRERVLYENLLIT